MDAEMSMALFISTIFGAVCAGLAAHKNRSAIGYGILGFLFPLIGIIVTLVISKIEAPYFRDDYRQSPPAPDGISC